MCEEIRSLRYLHRALRLECTILRRLVHFIPQIILICYWLLVFGGLGYPGTSLTWMMGLVYFWMDMREKAVSITASASPGVASATAKWDPRSTALLGVGGDSCAWMVACIV